MIGARHIAAVVAAAVLGAVVGAAVHRPTPPAPLLGDPDIAFAQNMSAHHQQAVTMSDMLTADASADVRALAEQIRSTQLVEIGQLTGWLQLIGAPPSAAEPTAVHSPGTHHAMTGMSAEMPGMATPSDLQRLQHTSGRDNETLYLQLMTRHHQGGVDMAAHVLRDTKTDVVRRAAAVMVDEQTQEIQVMTVLLNQRAGAPLPYP
jgi:uncharacterized protein (DUF305 family)